MKSRISIDFDRVDGGHGKQPLININLIRSEDAKDKLLEELIRPSCGVRYLEITHTCVSGDPLDNPSKIDLVHPLVPVFDLRDVLWGLSDTPYDIYTANLTLYDNRKIIISTNNRNTSEVDLEDIRLLRPIEMIKYLQDKITETINIGSQPISKF